MMFGSIRELDFHCQAFPRDLPRFRLRVGNCVWTLLCALFVCPAYALADGFSQDRLGSVVAFAAAGASGLVGSTIADLIALRCDRTHEQCRTVPLQVDERDAGYRWILDAGPAPVSDDPPGVLDDNDVLFFRAADAGDQVSSALLPPHRRAARLEISDPHDQRTAYLYLLEAVAPTGTHAPPLVDYDPVTDRLRGRNVALGFTAGVPQYLAIGDSTGSGANILDRIKVRASAYLLWGLLRFARSEADLTTEVVGWRHGPLRITRQQEQRVRLGWGIRSPQFYSYTFFYPDSVELPVSLRLAHRPAVLFGDIRVDVLLDFVDLRGWQLLLPGELPRTIGIDAAERSAASDGDWFALRSPEVTLLQILDVGPSLASTRRRLLYRESSVANPPEAHAGELPAVGFRIDQWQHVDAGAHHLLARCFALAPDADVERFVAALREPLVVRASALPNPEPDSFSVAPGAPETRRQPR